LLSKAIRNSVISGIFIAGTFSAVLAQDLSNLDVGNKPDKQIVAEQYLLLGTPTRDSGESQVAVNPMDPNEIVVAAMGVINSNQGRFQHSEVDFKRTTRAVLTRIAVSHDRGLTWSMIEDPMRAYFHRYRCLDPFAGFAADGTMIVGCEAQRSTSFDPEQQAEDLRSKGGATPGGPAIITSTDGGRTWSDPIQVEGYPTSKEILGPFVSLDPAVTIGDAPKLKIDRSTGKIYLDGQSRTTEAPIHSQTTFRMSSDEGGTWGMLYAFDSPEWPGGGGTYDVANGVLGAAYVASSVPAGLNAKCPCTVFAASRDDGKTFDRHLVPGITGRTYVAADPRRPNHFALMVQYNDHVEALLTKDAGMTWSAPKSLGAVTGTGADKVVGEFNDKGQLGISWRVIYKDPKAAPPSRGNRTIEVGVVHVFSPPTDSFELWSALSNDGGENFSMPLKVSTERSPPIPKRRGGSDPGAHFNTVALDHDYIHFSWYDARAGFLGTWYGRVPLKDYQFR
jgi:hypothetical protein